MEIAQEEKATLLERAVINSSVEELSKTYDKLGSVEMSAPALGLACRFRGLEIVKTLVQKGASFEFPLTMETEEKYHCYIGHNYENYRTNYSLYLLKVFRGEMKGACCLKGMAMNKNHKREEGKPLSFLPDDERVRVLNYLFMNKEKIAFRPEEMLFYAIYAKDAVIREELRRLGVKLSKLRVHIITDCGKGKEGGYWHEYSVMTGKLADEDYLDVMQQLALELDGKPFHYTENLFEITKKRFHDINIFEYFLAHFKQDKMNKLQMMRSLIDEESMEIMPMVEKEGWLNDTKKRDEMIDYASENGKTEALAWLLDFKNRTADLAAEQEKAEKKLMRELNAAPDSVIGLKKIWSYKKREDGTLMITNYKGTDIEVTVPEKIGKKAVTAIGDVAFSGNCPRFTREQNKQHQKITKIILPETIQVIGELAFYKLSVLKEINIPVGVTKIGDNAFEECSSLESIMIPEGVQEIGEWAFAKCSSLRSITIPGTVKKIELLAFCDCSNLEKVNICEGVLEIGKRVFENCSNLADIRIPKSVQCMMTQSNIYGTREVFHGCPKVVIYCPEGSRAEAYCREKGFQFKNSDELI